MDTAIHFERSGVYPLAQPIRRISHRLSVRADSRARIYFRDVDLFLDSRCWT